VDAVSAHNDVGLDLAAVCEARDREIAVGPHPGASLAQGDQAGRQRAGQHVEEIGPVHGRAGDAERGRLLLPARPADHPAGFPVPRDLPRCLPRDLADAALYSDGAQHLHRVRVQGDAGPDLLELGGRLVDRHLDPRPR
jgi:hypothetical protein